MDMTMSHSVTIDGTSLTEETPLWRTVGELLQRKNNDLVVSAEISGQILFRRCIRDGTERVRVRIPDGTYSPGSSTREDFSGDRLKQRMAIGDLGSATLVYLHVIMDMTMSHSVTIDGTCLTEGTATLEDGGEICFKERIATWRDLGSATPVYLQVMIDMTMSHCVTIDGTFLTDWTATLEDGWRIASKKVSQLGGECRDIWTSFISPLSFEMD
ncbi:hypothetical protein TNIN_252651 [Trichonephila inaurata madagascariensis]|uniref:Uncharacterized protein n=1 Tax=Trichonephila inaurata madagascariensis TaxID=2747483 RepID=A0A8X6X341_9ARAC|nr:hypothetical protein TNIN_252651 [Trichonephila inaurata madagascariensis]